MARDVRAQIEAPILSVIARELLALIKGDSQVREFQSINAPRACYFAAGVLLDTVPQVINEAKSGTGEVFYQLALVFDPTAGAVNVRIDGPPATALIGGGRSLPAGGGELFVTGMDNIRNFSMIAQAGGSAPFTRYLFK